MTRQWNGYKKQIRETFTDIIAKHGALRFPNALLDELVNAADKFTYTPFSKWIRDLNDSSSYDVENLDYIRFAYRPGWFVTIEEKRNGAMSSDAQNDLHNIIAQFMTIASGSKVKTWRGLRPITYKGHFVVSFEKTTPDDSTWVKINGKKYFNTRTAVIALFREGNIFDEPPAPLDEQVAKETKLDLDWLRETEK